MSGDVIPPPVALRQLANGFMVSQAIYVAAKLGIADLLAEGPKNCEEPAKAADAHAQSLYRVLRVLASMGVFAQDAEGRFRLTPLAEPLQSAVPGSLRAYAIMRGEAWHWRPWGVVLQGVKTGQTPFQRVHSVDFFHFLGENPEAAEVFNEAMRARQEQENRGVAAAYPFGGSRTVVDVGGGNGGLLASILEANPGVRGILFDLPHVAAAARERLEALGLTGRYRCIAGDFFTSVPEGGDAYLLSNVIHDWDDAPATRILTNCRRTMKPAARLLLIETIVPPGNDPSVAKLIDFQMLVLTGGRERTEAEYRALLESAGLTLARIIPTVTPISVLEAAPA